MAGVKGRSGGARPGAGRKTKTVTEVQEANRATVLRIVADARWEKIVERAAKQAEGGDPVARAWLTPYVAGKVPDELKVQQSGGVDVRVTFVEPEGAE